MCHVCMLNHCSNEAIMTQYLQKLWFPFQKSKLGALGLSTSQLALAMFDVFKRQQADYLELLYASNICMVVIPPNCTDK